MTATPLGKTRPLTNSSAAPAAMAAKRQTRRSGARVGVGARVLEAAGEVGRRKGAVEMMARRVDRGARLMAPNFH